MKTCNKRILLVDKTTVLSEMANIVLLLSLICGLIKIFLQNCII